MSFYSHTTGCMIQTQARKNERRIYWAKFIATEWASIVAIVWYLNMELIRTEQVALTYSKLQTVAIIQDELLRQAENVYHCVYRDKKQSAVRVVDCRHSKIDGRYGMIRRYDHRQQSYCVALKPTKGAVSNDNTVIVSPQNLESADPRMSVHDYNSKRKLETLNVSMKNPFTSGVFEVQFRPSVFESVRQAFKYPHENSDSAFNLMRQLIDQVEKKEQEDKERIEREQIEHERNLQNMMATKKSRQDHPRKRHRTHNAMPMLGRSVQICSHWKAKYEHFTKRKSVNASSTDEHLFTLPFITTDQTLFKLDDILTIVNCPNAATIDEIGYLEDFGSHEIVVTESSLDSLRPGHDLDDSVVDTCLHW